MRVNVLMHRIAKTVAAVLVMMAAPALAQTMAPPTDQAIQQARETMFQAEARYFLLQSQRMEAQASASAAKEAEKDRWWQRVWESLPAPVAEGKP